MARSSTKTMDRLIGELAGLLGPGVDTSAHTNKAQALFSRAAGKPVTFSPFKDNTWGVLFYVNLGVGACREVFIPCTTEEWVDSPSAVCAKIRDAAQMV